MSDVFADAEEAELTAATIEERLNFFMHMKTHCHTGGVCAWVCRCPAREGERRVADRARPRRAANTARPAHARRPVRDTRTYATRVTGLAASVQRMKPLVRGCRHYTPYCVYSDLSAAVAYGVYSGIVPLYGVYSGIHVGSLMAYTLRAGARPYPQAMVDARNSNA